MDYYDQLIEFLDSKEELEMQRRREIAQLITPEAEKAHQQILPAIQEFSNTSIARKVYSSKEIDKAGCILELNRRYHILINSAISNFDEDSMNYRAYKEKNPNESTRDLFKNTVAHEYGHIVFFEDLNTKLILQMTDNFQKPEYYVPKELYESFAFFFADFVTGSESSLERILPLYEDLEAAKTKAMYNELKSMGGDGLKLNNLHELALKYQ